MEPGLLVWFPDAAAKCDMIDLVAARTLLTGHVATWLVLYQFINMLTFFGSPIGFPYFSLGAFCMDLSQLEKETLSDLRYQWTNAMPTSRLQTEICAYSSFRIARKILSTESSCMVS